MKIHFISIGGSAMHNLALALQAKGDQITGSDDAIYEPSKSRLKAAGLLPEEMGWFPEKISPDLDAVILGMHAKADNPELKKAQELNQRPMLKTCREQQNNAAVLGPCDSAVASTRCHAVHCNH